MTNNIVTVIPTRGLIYTQTLESLRNNGINLDSIIFCVNKPIPEAQNYLVKKALDQYSSYVLFIEDDVVIPDGSIDKMVKADGAIVALNYPLDNGCETVCRKGKEVMWCGLGCTLVKRGVLTAIGDPWFTTDYSYRIEDGFTLVKTDNPAKYGGQDINFCLRAKELGFEIKVIEGEGLHLRCSNITRTEINQGFYQIQPLPSISQYQSY